MTEPELLITLRQSVAAAESQKAWCAKHGIAEPVLSWTLTGRRPMSEAVANALGFVRSVVYHRVNLGSE